MMVTPDIRTYSISEAARLLHVGRSTVKAMIEAGALEYGPLPGGKRSYISHASLFKVVPKAAPVKFAPIVTAPLRLTREFLDERGIA